MRIRPHAIITGIVFAVMRWTAAFAMADGSSQDYDSIAATLQNSVEPMPLKLGTSVRNGTVMSMTAARMIIVHVHKGKSELLEFVLNSETLRRGDVAIGSQVTVHYRTENNRNLATSIQTTNPPVQYSPD